MPFYIKCRFADKYQKISGLYGNYLCLKECDREEADVYETEQDALDAMEICDEYPSDYIIVEEGGMSETD